MRTRHGAMRTSAGPSQLTASINALHDPQARERTRPRALGDAIAEVARDVGGRSGPPSAAVRGFGGGCVALALGGWFDRAAVDDLEALLRRLRPLATGLLVIDLGALGGHHPRLGRVLGRARIRCLIDGVALSLHHLPPDLADELDLPAGTGSGPPHIASS